MSRNVLKKVLMVYAECKGLDQPGYPCNLIRAVAVKSRGIYGHRIMTLARLV